MLIDVGSVNAGKKETHLDTAGDVKLDDYHSSDGESDQKVSRILLSVRETTVALDEVLSEFLEG